MLRRTFIVFLLLALGCSSPLSQQSRGKGKGPKPPPEPVEMGILFFDGFERLVDPRTLEPPFDASSGNHPLDTTTPRTGGTAIKGNHTGLATLDLSNFNFDHAGGSDPPFNIATTYLSFYFRLDASMTDGDDIVGLRVDGTTQKLWMEYLTGDKLKIRTATGTTNGTTVLTTGEWYRIDIQCGTGASAFWELRINNTVEISATEDLNTTNMQWVRWHGNSGYTFTIDDVVLRDDEYHSDGDDFRIETLFPDGNGNYTSWTGTFTDVDEKEPDGTESSTSTNLDRETYTLGNLPTLSGDDTIDSVMIFAHLRKTVNSTLNAQIVEREGGTDRDTPSFGVLKTDSFATDAYRWVIRDTKPTGGAWTESAVNGLEVGAEHNQSQVRQLLLDVVNVNVLITTTAAPLSGKAGRMTLLGVQ